MTDAVKQNGHALRYASEGLKGDKRVAMEAVKHDFSVLKHASEELKGDRQVVMEAVRQTGRACKYAPWHFKRLDQKECGNQYRCL